MEKGSATWILTRTTPVRPTATSNSQPTNDRAARRARVRSCFSVQFVRPAMALASVGTAMVGAMVLMSDRAPGLLERISRRIDAGSSRAAQVASQTRPQSDFEIHIVLWAVITVVVGLTMWSNRSVLASAIVVLMASVVAERAQEALTISREMQLGDVA